MATQVQFRRGTTTQNNSFTGAAGEISVNTTLNVIRVHDGSTAGGFELAKSNLSNIADVGVITATDFNSTSDIKLKENIHSIDNPLNKVMQINGVGFRWKDTKENSFGVIAQDIEEVLPELVKNNDHTKTVNYNGLIGVLIEAVKEQQRQILELKAQLNDK